jgi:serpin B
MTYGGARGQTEQEMASTLHFDLPQKRFHPAFNALDLALTRPYEEPSDEKEDAFQLHVANSVWAQQGFDFLSEYLDLLALNYGAGLQLLDFETQPEKSRETINEWVSRQTAGKIENLIPPGLINSMTRMVLTNAVYFKASWLKQFEASATSDGAFTRLDGSQVTLPMMFQQDSFNYAQGPDFQAVALHYVGGGLDMVILLPSEGDFSAFEDNLDAARLAQILGSMSHTDLELTVPRFELESEFALGDTLKGMGMPTAFGNEADFSGMTGRKDLFIREVVHKSFVSVDEAGTEAAAATAVIMEELAVAEDELEPVVMTVDRPFIFLIHDRQTGTLLFMGRVLHPVG